MKYDSLENLLNMAKSQNISFSRLILKTQSEILEIPEDELFETMKKSLAVMKSSVEQGLLEGTRSVSGLTGGDAYKMNKKVLENRNVCGKIFGTALVKSIAVAETNACMGKIVASPTAGSCGIIPAALLTIAEDRNIHDDDLVLALFTASGIGLVIANNASISGAEGGCQAECGSASAMASGALVELLGGDYSQISHAVAIALKNILGLVCDPVAGLVEIPCIKRNALGVTNALTATELALADIKSAIPADEVIIAMKKIGDAMSKNLKETAEGGLAVTPTGKKLCKQVFSE